MAALGTCQEAADLALELDVIRLEKPSTFKGRILCDYGVVSDRSGKLDDNLLARMAAGGDFPSFPDTGVLAAAPFARELQFLAPEGLQVVSLGHRVSQVGNSERIKITPGLGFFRLLRIE